MISIKPHHFIDIITSFGDGIESFPVHPYGHAVHTVAALILDDPITFLVMEVGVDDICAPCMHNHDGVCDDTIDTSYRPDAPPMKQDWNLLIDRRWCKRLNIMQGDRLTARSFCELLRDTNPDITDIYREIPEHRTAKRSRKLFAGVEKYLVLSE
ncbi:hypothetical protein ACFL47_03480 [Candidatus Latescibacterota bacterium]